MHRPTVLTTGFTPFPGAPVNPAQWLMAALNADEFAEICNLHTAVLPVDYATVAQELDAAADRYQPDIVIHFGLAAEAHGIRLERLARNEIAADRQDNSGRVPQTRHICMEGGDLESGLPLEAIARELERRGLPVQWSDNAGGYLCNYVFYTSRAGLCPAVRTPMTGFIHVPLLGEAGSGESFRLSQEQLLKAAGIIIRCCVEEWRATARQ